MDREDLIEARGRLEAFLKPLLPLLGRSERRRWGAFNIQGLLVETGRKTAAGLSARLSSNVQAVQQFVNQSPWDWLAVRQAMAQEMVRQAACRGAWILGRYEEKEKRLKELIQQKGLKIVGEPVFARYNPPFMPWFLRRNEVLIPVAR